jgi:hypothetical protein
MGFCKRLILMVGTGRFELPNGSALPRSPRRLDSGIRKGECQDWGVSWVGTKSLPEIETAEENEDGRDGQI